MTVRTCLQQVGLTDRHSADLHPESDACCQEVFKHLPVTDDEDGGQVGGVGVGAGGGS